MRFIQSALFSILASSTAILALECNSTAPGAASVSDIQSCIDFIQNASVCIIEGQDHSGFCTQGTAKISATNYNGTPELSISCSELGDAAQAILDQCAQDGVAGGENGEVTNGEFSVIVGPSNGKSH
ncbi:hypothetical protein BDW62DRAFT_202162 [Aspergillus aurantiobrunneus]